MVKPITNRKNYMKGVHSLLLLPSLFARHGPALVTLRNFHSSKNYCYESKFRYKSRSYRARAVREPRAVLAEFGLTLPVEKKIIVHDSTADVR